MKDRKKELVKNTLIIAFGKLSTQFLTFLLLPVYTSKISSAEYGNIDLIISYSTFLIPILTIQQEFAVFRFLIDARGDDKKSSEIISTGLSTMLKILLPISILITPILFTLNIQFAEWVALNIIATALVNFFLQVSRGMGENLKYSTACILSGIINIGLNLLLIFYLQWGGQSILIASIVSNFIGTVYLIFSLKLGNKLRKNLITPNTRSTLIKYALPIMLNGVSWWVINASDRTILAYFVSLSAVGVYAAANTFASVVNGLFYIFNMSWSESASVYLKSKDAEEYFSDVFNTMVKIFALICSGLIFILPIIFKVLIKNDYSESYIYIPALVFSAFISGIANYYSSIYSALLIPKKITKTTVIAGIINIVIDLVLVYFIGVYAAIISTIVAFLAMLVIRHRDISKMIRVKIEKTAVFYAVFCFIAANLFFYVNDVRPRAIVGILFMIISATLIRQILKTGLKIIRKRSKV